MKGSRIWTHDSEDTSTQYQTNHKTTADLLDSEEIS